MQKKEYIQVAGDQQCDVVRMGQLIRDVMMIPDEDLKRTVEYFQQNGPDKMRELGEFILKIKHLESRRDEVNYLAEKIIDRLYLLDLKTLRILYNLVMGFKV